MAMKQRTTLDGLLAKANAKAQRKKPSDEEHRIQQACVQWFNLRHPNLRGRLFAVPNGSRRDGVTGARLKAEGVVAGVSDFILLKSTSRYGALLIEMKTRTGRQSATQKWWQQVVTENGEYKYVVCRCLDDFIREVDGYLECGR